MVSSPTAQQEKCCSSLLPRDIWKPPSLEGKFRTGLFVNNSMAGEKVEFVPHRAGRSVYWYGCGPTVYDAAHMGHARTYLAFDIIRRIMNDYFGYHVFLCMNITDIDDKIIARSAEQGKDFACLARYWEGKFWQDMRELNVLLPDVITRVSEYVPEVISFIEKIVANGYGYQSGGSVYFDVQGFRKSQRHVYGRMEPWSVNDEARVLEGEGALGDTVSSEKRSPLDFALWKKNKPGEPSWPSPWGPGRPGWHIECSAMASTILGFPLDIHSGGIDLRFPHHDNELAQSEANYNKEQWVNYFLHSGHLHIKGSKMSKSLKNFITIREALQVFSPRSFRFLTLMHRWDAPMNYSPDGDSMQAAAEVDKSFVNFFGAVAAALREGDLAKNTDLLLDAKKLGDVFLQGILKEQRWDKDDEEFHQNIIATQEEVHAALCDNFDTPRSLTALRTLVGTTNVYLRSNRYKGPLLLKAAKFVFRMLKVFGVTSGSEATLDYVDGNTKSIDDGLIDCLAKFRQNVRLSSQQLFRDLKRNKSVELAEAVELVQGLLNACDDLRDKQMIEFGVQLEDSGNDSVVWKKSTKEELLKEQERRRQDEERKAAAKAEAEKLRAEAEAKKARELAIPPEEYLKATRGDQFSAFDKDGLPTHDKDGNAVSKGQRDKLLKVVTKHKAAHEKWRQQQNH